MSRRPRVLRPPAWLLLAAHAAWFARSNAVKAVAVWSITAVVFGVSIIFYARAYPVDSGLVALADANIAAAVVLAVVAWHMPRVRFVARGQSTPAKARG